MRVKLGQTAGVWSTVQQYNTLLQPITCVLTKKYICIERYPLLPLGLAHVVQALARLQKHIRDVVQSHDHL